MIRTILGWFGLKIVYIWRIQLQVHGKRKIIRIVLYEDNTYVQEERFMDTVGGISTELLPPSRYL